MSTRFRNPEWLVRAAALLALVGLSFIAASILIPKPLAVVAGMTVGQGLGTLSLLLYLRAIWVDRTERAERADRAEK
jgi:hypothetical protein